MSTPSMSRLPRLRTLLTATALAVSAGAVAVAITAAPAAADPGCRNGGVYKIWARGSGQPINAAEATEFKRHLEYALNAAGITSYAWAELGNFDGNGQFSQFEYNPIPWNQYLNDGFFLNNYGQSVAKGTDELVIYLNNRVNTCPTETIVLGGYSQGADVIGWALSRTGTGALSALAKSRIGYAALYGDPKNLGNLGQVGDCFTPPWVRGDAPCDEPPVQGALDARVPYVPSGWETKIASWCADGDRICDSPQVYLPWDYGTHTSAYRNWWIWQSAAEIAGKARIKVCSLVSCSPPPSGGGGGGGSTPPPPPVINTDDPLNDVFQATGEGSIGWRVSYSGTSSWISLRASATAANTLLIGDFDQDGKEDDVFQAAGDYVSGWRVSYNGTSSWQSLMLSGTSADTLFIGDFDEDGYNDDVFQASGDSSAGWRVSLNGNTSWKPLRLSTTTKGTLLLGDFDSDGYRDDVFQATGDPELGWRVSFNGTSSWETLRFSTTTKDSLLLGDFDGQGHSNDVFQATGDPSIGWRVSYNGASPWSQLRVSTTTVDTLLIGDFDGDGRNDDIFQATGDPSIGWRKSLNAMNSWQTLRISTTTKGTLMLANF